MELMQKIDEYLNNLYNDDSEDTEDIKEEFREQLIELVAELKEEEGLDDDEALETAIQNLEMMFF